MPGSSDATSTTRVMPSLVKLRLGQRRAEVRVHIEQPHMASSGV